MKLIVGIGNPGKEYEKTRHNIGFRVLEALRSRKLRGAHLLKPSSYVNRTGDEILEFAQRHPVKSTEVLVVCDDINLPFGKLRLRGRGSSGGHKGLASVIGVLNTEDFPRLRVGIGPAAAPKDLSGFVLSDFTKAEEKALAGVLKKAVHICEIWVKEGLEGALNRMSSITRSGS